MARGLCAVINPSIIAEDVADSTVTVHYSILLMAVWLSIKDLQGFLPAVSEAICIVGGSGGQIHLRLGNYKRLLSGLLKRVGIQP